MKQKKRKTLHYLLKQISLVTDIKKYSFEAEKKKDLTLLTKANIFWKSKIDKEKTIAALDIALGKLENDLKALE